jgi:hypothetical protein
MKKIYKTPFGNTLFDVSRDHIIVRMSGGFDSAVMLYTLAATIMNFNRHEQVVIYPITIRKIGEEYQRPGMSKRDPEPIVKNIISFVKEHYPKINIETLVIGDLENFWERDGDREIFDLQTSLIATHILTKLPKTSAYYDYIGTTKNPPVLFESWMPAVLARNFDIPRHVYEDTVSIFSEPNSLIMPFRNSDKRITFALADQFNVLPGLIDKTWSCEGFKNQTDDFSRTCGECWWCKEREWTQQEYKK